MSTTDLDKLDAVRAELALVRAERDDLRAACDNNWSAHKVLMSAYGELSALVSREARVSDDAVVGALVDALRREECIRDSWRETLEARREDVNASPEVTETVRARYYAYVERRQLLLDLAFAAGLSDAVSAARRTRGW